MGDGERGRARGATSASVPIVSGNTSESALPGGRGMVPGSGHGLGSGRGGRIGRNGRAADVGDARRFGADVACYVSRIANGGNGGNRYLGKRACRRRPDDAVARCFFHRGGFPGCETWDVVSGNLGAFARSRPSRLDSIHEGSRTARIFGIADKSAHGSFHSGRVIPDDESGGGRKDSSRLDEAQRPRFVRRSVCDVSCADEDVIGVRGIGRYGRKPRKDVYEKPGCVGMERYSEFLRIELQFGIIRISGGIVRSRRSVRTGNEKRWYAAKNDHRRTGEGVLVVVDYVFPGGLPVRRRFRGNCGKDGTDVRGALRVKRRSVVR